MKAQDIARTLLNRRNAMNPIVMQGEMLAALESEGLQEALSRRWLVPEPNSGCLMVSQDMAKVMEMREIAEAEEKKKDGEKDEKEGDKKKEWTKPWEQPNESHKLAMSHSTRPLSELLSPATGHDPDRRAPAPTMPAPTTRPIMPAGSPTAPPAQPAAPAQAVQPAGPQKPGVGDDVMVVGEGTGQPGGQTFSGKVTSAANGKVKINFGGREEREYPENEVQLVNKAGAAR